MENYFEDESLGCAACGGGCPSCDDKKEPPKAAPTIVKQELKPSVPASATAAYSKKTSPVVTTPVKTSSSAYSKKTSPPAAPVKTVVQPQKVQSQQTKPLVKELVKEDNTGLYVAGGFLAVAVVVAVANNE